MLRVVTLFIVILVDLLRFTSIVALPRSVHFFLQIFLLQSKLATLNYPFGISHMLFESHLLISQLSSDSFLCNGVNISIPWCSTQKTTVGTVTVPRAYLQGRVSKEMILSSFS